jgi:hypothetical protein
MPGGIRRNEELCISYSFETNFVNDNQKKVMDLTVSLVVCCSWSKTSDKLVHRTIVVKDNWIAMIHGRFTPPPRCILVPVHQVRAGTRPIIGFAPRHYRIRHLYLDYSFRRRAGPPMFIADHAWPRGILEGNLARESADSRRVSSCTIISS